MSLVRRLVPGLVLQWLESLRFPWILLLTVLVLVGDLVVPDAIPLVDEILLMLTTLVLARLRKRRGELGEGGRQGNQAGDMGESVSSGGPS